MSTAVCQITDVPMGSAGRYDIGGTAVVLVHAEDGFYALSDACSHAEVSLAAGEVAGRSIECWLHGSRFDLATGQPSGPPARSPVQTYPVTIDGESVLVTVPPRQAAETGHRDPHHPERTKA